MADADRCGGGGGGGRRRQGRSWFVYLQPDPPPPPPAATASEDQPKPASSRRLFQRAGGAGRGEAGGGGKETPGTPVHPRLHPATRAQTSPGARRHPLPPTQTPTRHWAPTLHNLVAAPPRSTARERVPLAHATRPAGEGPRGSGASGADTGKLLPAQPKTHRRPLGREHPPLPGTAGSSPSHPNTPPHVSPRKVNCTSVSSPTGHPPASTPTPKANLRTTRPPPTPPGGAVTTQTSPPPPPRQHPPTHRAATLARGRERSKKHPGLPPPSHPPTQPTPRPGGSGGEARMGRQWGAVAVTCKGGGGGGGGPAAARAVAEDGAGGGGGRRGGDSGVPPPSSSPPVLPPPRRASGPLEPAFLLPAMCNVHIKGFYLRLEQNKDFVNSVIMTIKQNQEHLLELWDFESYGAAFGPDGLDSSSYGSQFCFTCQRRSKECGQGGSATLHPNSLLTWDMYHCPPSGHQSGCFARFQAPALIQSPNPQVLVLPLPGLQT
uniref:basic proline-rich protein-like n=1 Tax=Jaculus jaculus TaxID=51337 RepID=UPI001E1B33B1|nr:basic proline-rich protein-like [Jaculus jaculus]